MTSQGRLASFVAESNRIESIHRDPLPQEIEAHETFLALEEIRVEHLETFVGDVAGASLRRLPGMDVIVGSHEPPPGGPRIESYLHELLSTIQSFDITPWEAHVEYETLHPFSDGNGRSGRVLWAWQVAKEGRDPFVLPVLQLLYYAALEGSR